MSIGVVSTIAVSAFVAPARADAERCDADRAMVAGTCRPLGELDRRGAVAQADQPSSAPQQGYEAAPAEPPPDEEDVTASHLNRVAWVGFGVGAAGLLLWGVTGGIAVAQAGSLDDDCPDDVCPAEQEDDLDDAKTMADIATAGFVVSLTGAFFGVIALIAKSGRDEGDAGDAGGEPTASVRPQIGPGYFGLSGTF